MDFGFEQTCCRFNFSKANDPLYWSFQYAFGVAKVGRGCSTTSIFLPSTIGLKVFVSKRFDFLLASRSSWVKSIAVMMMSFLSRTWNGMMESIFSPGDGLPSYKRPIANVDDKFATQRKPQYNCEPCEFWLIRVLGRVRLRWNVDCFYLFWDLSQRKKRAGIRRLAHTLV